MTINLTAKNATETRVLEYLQQNASEVLAEKINTGTKTLAGALSHAKAEAKKLAGGEVCVMVDDATVFGWIVHFFEEESITEKAKAGPKLPGAVAAKPAPAPKAAAAPKAAPKAAAPVKPAKQPAKAEGGDHLSMLEALFGGDAK
jgi:ribosomal protein L12E/L44/L45/RPP1/RPP2